jgi:hypothetical protein
MSDSLFKTLPATGPELTEDELALAAGGRTLPVSGSGDGYDTLYGDTTYQGIPHGDKRADFNA